MKRINEIKFEQWVLVFTKNMIKRVLGCRWILNSNSKTKTFEDAEKLLEAQLPQSTKRLIVEKRFDF